jgi:uncharacterized protein (TIGR03435 family)
MFQVFHLASLIAVLSSSLFSQSTFAQATPTAFEVATIRAAAPAAAGGRASSSGDRVTLNNTTLSNALIRAFGLTSNSQVAGPSWIFDSRYDIVAKAPDNSPREQMPSMLQTLLIDRFKLVLHHETRELPAYALTVGKTKLKLVEDDTNPKNSGVMNEGRREMRSMNMATLAQNASLTLRTPVLDRTGLSGYYDFPYDLSREETLKDSAPSIFTILEELGLKLDSHKEPFDVIVIDSGNKVPVGD